MRAMRTIPLLRDNNDAMVMRGDKRGMEIHGLMVDNWYRETTLKRQRDSTSYTFPIDTRSGENHERRIR